MKKTLLALAISAFAANAFAVDLDNTTAPGTQVFAKEIKVVAAGTDIGTTNITATVASGFALSEGFIRFDLSNGAEFETAPSLTVDSLATPDIAVASGGAGFDFVIFKVSDTHATAPVGITATATVELSSEGAGITVINKEAVSITYGLYETAAAAANKTGALNSKSGTLLSFSPALVVTAESAVGADSYIDAIASEAKKFDNNGTVELDTDLVTLTAGVLATDTPLKLDGSAAVAYSDIVASEIWKLTGNFSAVAESGFTGATGAAIAEDKQSVTFTSTGTVNYKVTGQTEIAETAVAATYTPTAQNNYEASAVSFSNVAELNKNGTTVDVDLALKPGGAYSNFVRISNKDTIEGAFFIKVINDAGQSESFPLSDIAGQPATLAAGASTTQLSIQEVFDAAAAKGLTLSGQGKLRLEVTGQTNDLDVQIYTVSKDGNSFATF